MAIVADSFEETEEGNLVVAKTGPCLVGANVLDENGSRRESRKQKPLPEALASLQSLICRFPHSCNANTCVVVEAAERRRSFKRTTKLKNPTKETPLGLLEIFGLRV